MLILRLMRPFKKAWVRHLRIIVSFNYSSCFLDNLKGATTILLQLLFSLQLGDNVRTFLATGIECLWLGCRGSLLSGGRMAVMLAIWRLIHLKSLHKIVFNHVRNGPPLCISIRITCTWVLLLRDTVMSSRIIITLVRRWWLILMVRGLISLELASAWTY